MSGTSVLTTPDMTPSPELVKKLEDYFAVYSIEDPALQKIALAEVWSETGIFVDALVRFEGLEAVQAMAGRLQQRLPGHKFKICSKIQAHNEFAHYQWQLLNPAGEVVSSGRDVMIFNEEGKIEMAIGFLGEWLKASD